MNNREIEIFDTTLRDGTQAEDIAFSVDDKLRIARRLDEMGFTYIEGGWPGSNPRDEDFFSRAKSELNLRNAKLAAFGSTARFGKPVSQDGNITALLRAETPVVVIFGKTWDLHVRDDLGIQLTENVDLIGNTVRYLVAQGREVIFDAEHFFDGYAASPAFAIKCIEAAVSNGASVVCLCDTNGGKMSWEITDTISALLEQSMYPPSISGQWPYRLGIHCHNDGESAVANTLAAVRTGEVTHVQGTINGIGERCGNANLCSIIGDLQLKMGTQVLTDEQLAKLTSLSRFVAELANQEPPRHAAFVGQSAFAHKGGIHVAAVRKNSETYEHVSPELVGNEQRILISDLSGRGNVLAVAERSGLSLDPKDDAVRHAVQEVKRLENQGYQFEAAEASFALRLRRQLGEAVDFFTVQAYRVIADKRGVAAQPVSEATVQVQFPDGSTAHKVAVGNGPVNAADLAIREALETVYPILQSVALDDDFKVRVIQTNGDHGSRSTVRVLVQWRQGDRRWGTVGVSHDVIEASWLAVVDGFNYALLLNRN